MDLLGGEDMSKLRNRAREASGINLVTLPAAVYLAQEMLTCIESMHKRGFIHRDIKPANFVRREKESTKFAMIDFGLAKQVNTANRSFFFLSRDQRRIRSILVSILSLNNFSIVLRGCYGFVSVHVSVLVSLLLYLSLSESTIIVRNRFKHQV